MKHKFKFAAVDTEGVEVLAFALTASQGQAERVFYAMAYAMATDGGYKHARLSLVLRDGTERQLNAADFKGGK